MAALRECIVAVALLVLATASVHGSAVETDESKWHEATVVPKLSKVTEDNAGHKWTVANTDVAEPLSGDLQQPTYTPGVEDGDGRQDSEKFHLRPALIEAANPRTVLASVSSKKGQTPSEKVHMEPAVAKKATQQMEPAVAKTATAPVVTLRSKPSAPKVISHDGPAGGHEHARSEVPLPRASVSLNPAHKLSVEVYVMALCPYCHDWILGFNEAVMNPSLGISPYLNVRVRFVVRSNNTLAETGDVSIDDVDFKCLHGDVECDTDTIMLCAMRDAYESGNGQDSFWPFLVEMEKNREGNQTDSYVDLDLAPEFGLNGENIEECRDGQLGKHLLLAEALHCEEKGLFATPTVFYDGVEYKPDDDDYLGQVCQAMRNASLPVMPKACNGVPSPLLAAGNSTDAGSTAVTMTMVSRKSTPSLQETESGAKKGGNGMRGGKTQGTSIYQGPIEPPGQQHHHPRKEVDTDVVVLGKPMVPPPAPPPPGKKGFWKDLFSRGFERAVEDIASDIAKGAHGLEGMLVGSSGSQQ